MSDALRSGDLVTGGQGTDGPGTDGPGGAGDGDLGRVAVTGMAGRFPGAGDVETFWSNLTEGRESVSVLTEEELRASGVDPGLLAADGYVPAKGVLADGDMFDAGFFGYSPREAEVMDPQHRVFLECAWAALESAGCDPRTFDGRIGVFAGSSMNSYLLFNVMANAKVYRATGSYQTLLASDKDFLATRASYKLGLKGPSLTVQTACSTSLTAVHLACQSLLNGECDIAIAGGVSVSAPLRAGYLHEPGGILSPDGHCRPFSADAAGTVAGNGVGVVVLRRLADATAAGDTVDAVILGTAVNNDGSLKAGYTAPSVDGQAEVIAEALAVADVDPATIGYLEAHGTGTALGDPIEIAALTRAWREYTQDTGFCAIGSVKGNVGHLDAAAGVTALIKATLALKHRTIPATLHCDRPNPELRLDTSPFRVSTTTHDWPGGDTPRRAGVSAFGIGGTNVHLILEEAPAPAAPGGPGGSARAAHLLPLSARDGQALAEQARRLAGHLDRHPGTDLADAAYTLARRRAALECRTAVVCRDREEAVAALRRIAPGDGVTAADPAPVAFLFPGQGSQYPGMARESYVREPVFAAALDRCAELFAAETGEDPRLPLFPAPADAAAAEERLRHTEVTQPVLFTVEYALARLWTSWGVTPRAMAGHSVGELVAACLAGVFSLPDAVRLVAGRGRLVAGMPEGAMLGVFLSEEETAARLGDGLALAAVNSTGMSVVSGPAGAVEDLRRRLVADGVACRSLHTSHAFHSPSMDAAVEPFVELVRSVPLSPPRIPFCSGVTGTWITDEQATSPEYWGRQLRAPVRFSGALEELLADPATVLLEVGPGRTLTGFARHHRAWDERRTAVDSLPHPKDPRDDHAYLLRALGGLWSAGVPVAPDALHPGGADRRVLRLPTYPFRRQRYWTEPDTTAGAAAGPGPLTAAGSVDDWFHTPGWRRLAPGPGTAAPAAGQVWLLLGDDLPLGRELAAALTARGADVVRAAAGDALRRGDEAAGPDGPGGWTLDVTDREHYAALLSALDLPAERTLRVVHLWSLGGGPDGPDPAAGPTPERLAAARRTGFDSLLALAQGIGDARPAGPVEIDVVCRGIRSVTGEEPLRPENAPLLGACTVIPQEVPETSCRTLDITGADPLEPGPGTVDALLALLHRSTGDRDLALRGRHWWVRDFDPVKLAAPPGAGVRAPGGPADPETAGRPPLRDGGVYLITGGLGGVGLALAERIATEARRPVIGLLGRSGFPAEESWDGWLAAHDERDATSRRIRRLRDLHRLGARTVLLRADVTDRGQLAAAVAELRAHGPLAGVVHAAGLPSNGMIAGKSAADADEVFAAKTLGTLALDEVLRDEADCDFLLLCSSLTAVLGGPGQSDYCGANAFLDVYAQSRRDRPGPPVRSVAWDTWRGVGMAAGLAERLGGEPEGEPTGHPLLRLVRSADGARTYRTTLSTASSWIVDEHRIMGHGLVPGTTYLELVRAAVAEQAAGRDTELRDVLFMMPVVVPDGQTRDVYTTIEPDGEEVRFTVRSRVPDGSGAWQDHATGSVRFPDPAAAEPRDLAEVEAACRATEVLESEEEIHRRLKLDRAAQGGPMTFSFGPRWRCLRRIRAGCRRLLVTLELDDAYRGDVAEYGLHPALLDVAGASARIHAEDVYYLPFTYRSLRVLAPLTATIHCDVVLKESEDSTGETLTCDVEILDPAGRPLVRITDFTIKRINDVEGLLAQVERAAAAPEAGSGDAPDGVLRTLGEGMSERDGATAFARLLAAADAPEHVVVSARDLAGLRRLARSVTPALLAREMERLAPVAGTHPRPELPTPFVAPEGPEQLAVAEVWQEVLGVDRVGVDDDFFALGGHSLAAVRIGAKLQSRFGVELDLRNFFDSPTVAGTVALLAAAGDRPERAEEAIPVLGRAEPDEDGAAEVAGLSDEEVEAELLALLALEADGPAGGPDDREDRA
ncbi:beta-ketoacyl synthase N-terminal-like domain-containing protein [Streptomyces sp. NPDC018031]|uniref:type I polyketide synthase n=1 Tax=Streptomyces sp. NPDC018031 TaxID=3365033 RepID=UPI0037A646B9